jgi:L-alanine-DL-glutamate epimerase-like enolase superfamily enzyme
LHAHLVASTPNARYVEFFPDDQVLNFRRLVGTQIEVRDGHIEMSQCPGMGFDFDVAALDRYAMNPWTQTGRKGDRTA